ncbi:PTS lactose/cellobiose transporter subunit IIA [Haloimpatiens sp. FM7315]|uniref:PTS lactose/cellobiose transporter subunit IIA n=1 Tax=Haloimpatiens sp. FM7315 TaxID=3298609 RepID=UPI00370B55DB
MNEELEKQVFGIISQAGDAKSDVMYSLKKVKEGNYEAAKDLLKEASKKLNEASKVHMEILNSAINNGNEAANFLVVHAEDHYSSASFAHSLVSELIGIFEKLDK